MYNLCAMARGNFLEFAPAVFKDYKKYYDQDARLVFITMNPAETSKVESMFSPGEATVCELSAFMNAHWDEFTLEKLVEYEKKYDASPIWKYIYTDRFLIHRDYDYTVHTAAGLFAFWEHVFTEYNIDFYYDECVSTLLTYVAYLVGKKTGCEYFTQFFMRAVGMDLTHHYYANDPFEMMDGMPDDYLERDYSPKQIKQATDFLDKYEKEHSKPKFMQFSGRKPKFKANYLLLPFFWIRQRFFNPSTRDKGCYIYYKAYEETLNPVKFYFRYKRCRKYFNKADLTKKFVYFPLHMQPEATTIVCAQKYEKQLYFLDNLAKSLPADTVIYAKEHYSFLGSRQESFYKSLMEYPNIVVIDPWEDSLTLIEKCECVATLTGTAGQEAMMLRRPVIMCGDILYKNAPGIMHIDDIYENYLPAMESWQQPSREDIIKYLAAYMSCAKEGNSYCMSPARFEPDNLRLLAESMHDYFEKRKKTSPA